MVGLYTPSPNIWEDYNVFMHDARNDLLNMHPTFTSYKHGLKHFYATGDIDKSQYVLLLFFFQNRWTCTSVLNQQAKTLLLSLLNHHISK